MVTASLDRSHKRAYQGLKYIKMSTTHREGRWRGLRPRARHGGAKRRIAEGSGSEEGRHSPSTVSRSGGIAPRKIWNLTVHICSFLPRFQDTIALPSVVFHSPSEISIAFFTSHNTFQQSQLHTWQSQLHTLCQKTHNFRPWICSIVTLVWKYKNGGWKFQNILLVSTQYTNASDSQTDSRTARRHRLRLCIASLGRSHSMLISLSIVRFSTSLQIMAMLLMQECWKSN